MDPITYRSEQHIAHRIEAIIMAQAANFTFTIEYELEINAFENAAYEKMLRADFHKAIGAAETHRMLIWNSRADGTAFGAWDEILADIYKMPTTRAELDAGEWVEEQEQAFLKALNDGTLRERIKAKVEEGVAEYKELRAAEERRIAEEQH